MKNFDDWNGKKKKIEKSNFRPFFFEREIWFTKIGKNIGDEEDGKGDNFLRPVLILKKFNKNIFLGIPLTSQKKEGKYYFKFNFIKNKDSYAILSQIKLIDAKRLRHRKGKIESENFKILKQKISNIITE